MLSLGIPNGSLYEPTVDILKKVGVTLLTEGRKFNVEVKGINIFKEALVMRPQDIPEALTDKVIDIGICGWDCVVESGLQNKLTKIRTLDYNKKSNGPIKVVVFGKESKIVDSKNILVASEYPSITGSFFQEAVVRFSYGSTEVKVASGKYDYGVCITETGQSIADNGLKVLKTLLVSQTVLIAREETVETKLFGDLLMGAIEGGKYSLVKMNVSKKDRDKVVRNLPSLKSPTVEKRADGSFAIETVIKKDEIANIVIAIKKAGATDILVQDINTVL